MPVDVLARCARCKRLLPHKQFAVIQIVRDQKTRKRRVVYDKWCLDCRPYVSLAEIRSDRVDPKPPDR